MRRLASLFQDRNASTAVEFALVATLVSIALIAGLSSSYDSMTAMFLRLAETYADAGG